MLNRNYKIKPVDSIEELQLIRELAYKIWSITYAEILSAEQIGYMLETLYSTDLLKSQMESGSGKFLLLYENDIAEGFATYSIKSAEILKIDKLYVNPEKHGCGFGRLLIEEISEFARRKKISALELNVNRENPAKGFYEKRGFSIIEEVDIPIGPYYMNDYIMRKAL